jgi:hypothetical protein
LSLPDFSLTPTVVTTTIAPGGSNSYALNLAPVLGFTQDVGLRLTGSNAVPGFTGTPAALNLTGLPAAATASFVPAVVPGGSGTSTLTVTTSATTPPGNYTLVINGISSDGVRTHFTTVPLVITGTPGDVTGDGTVDCDDLAAVRAAFGKSVGQAGYDPRTDFNGDGFVNIQDLQFLVQHLPAGTTCH